MKDYKGQDIYEKDEVVVVLKGNIKEGVIKKTTDKGAKVELNGRHTVFIKSQYIYKKE